MTMNTADIIQFSLLVATILGLVFSIWSNTRQFNDLKNQIRLQVFADYTKRYQEIKFRFPSAIYSAGFELVKLDDESKEDVLRSVRAYFDLCSEEFFLAEKKMIDQNVWNMWKDEILESMTRPIFQQVWKKIESEYETYPAFVTFVNAARQNISE